MEPNGENPAPSPQSQDPRARLEELKAQIDAAKAQKAESMASAPGRFRQMAHTAIPEEAAILRYSDAPEDMASHYEAYDKARGEYEASEAAKYDMDIAALEDAYEKASTEISEQETAAQIKEAQTKFMAENPDVDFAALGSFYANDMTPRQKEELAASTPPGDMTAYYAGVLQLMDSKNPRQKQKLPPTFEGTQGVKIQGGMDMQQLRQKVGGGK